MAFAVVVALGNPGANYVRTRHNLGWMLTDAWATRHSLSWQHEERFEASVVRSPADGLRKEFWILKPLTFMNLSGKSVQAFMRWHRFALSDILVVHDEISLNLGQLKVSPGGGSGGHNGVSDIIQRVGPEFHRLRLGIGPKVPSQMTQADFVLAPFRGEEQPALELSISAGLNALDLLLRLSPSQAMNQLNRPTISNRPT